MIYTLKRRLVVILKCCMTHRSAPSHPACLSSRRHQDTPRLHAGPGQSRPDRDPAGCGWRSLTPAGRVNKQRKAQGLLPRKSWRCQFRTAYRSAGYLRSSIPCLAPSSCLLRCVRLGLGAHHLPIVRRAASRLDSPVFVGLQQAELYGLLLRLQGV